MKTVPGAAEGHSEGRAKEDNPRARLARRHSRRDSRSTLEPARSVTITQTTMARNVVFWVGQKYCSGLGM